ncbi:MAG: F0F1 ATP synthase subunit A, partial [Opitutales bacterium]|nr:F0F1 ATP synthase subunit A [Opitutales bacterium]
MRHFYLFGRKIFRGLTLRAVCVFALLFSSDCAYASNSLKPDIMFRLGGLPVTNSMLTAAAFCVIIALFFRFALLRGGAKEIPSKGQIFVEAIIDGAGSVLSPIMGKRAYRGAAPYLICLFTFILAMNLGSLLPGVGTVGLEREAIVSAADAPAYEAQGFEIAKAADGALKAEKFVPFIRPAHTDLNMTLALALISFFLFFYFVKKYAGFGALYHEWFGNKAKKSEVPAAMYYALFPVFFAVGFIEVISACVRPISLSFRLFGNVFGGETLLEAMHGMAISGGA